MKTTDTASSNIPNQPPADSEEKSRSRRKSPAITCVMRGGAHGDEAHWIREIDDLGTVEQAQRKARELAGQNPGAVFRVGRIWPSVRAQVVTKTVVETVTNTRSASAPADRSGSPGVASDSASPPTGSSSATTPGSVGGPRQGDETDKENAFEDIFG